MISVIGRGDGASSRAKELATEVGRLLAQRGATVVCGGLGGVMEAACKGAKVGGRRRQLAYCPVRIRNPPTNGSTYRSPPDSVTPGTYSSSKPALQLSPWPALTARSPKSDTASPKTRPVVGLETWDLDPPDGTSDRIIRATDPEDAVNKAMAIAQGGRP